MSKSFSPALAAGASLILSNRVELRRLQVAYRTGPTDRFRFAGATPVPSGGI